jgi:hypothetical protein
MQRFRQLPPATRGISWWAFLLSVDAVLVMNSILIRYLPDFPGKWHIFMPIDLGREMNPAVWWSSLGLLVTSLYSYHLFCVRRHGQQVVWLALSLFCVVLAADEIGSLHERTPPGLFRFLIVAFAVIVLSMLTQLWRDSRTRKTGFAVMIACLLFGSVIIQELLETFIDWPSWIQPLRLGVEEGTELLGIFVLLWGVLSQYRTRVPSNHLELLIPDPSAMRGLISILFCGFMIHLLVSVYLTPTLDDLARRGDPSAIFPTFCYFVVFSSVYWRCARSDSELRGWSIVLSVPFLLSSLGSMYDFSRSIPGIDPSAPPGNIDFLSIALVLILAISWKLRLVETGGSRWACTSIAVGMAVLAWRFGPEGTAVVQATLSFLLATLLLQPSPRESQAPPASRS